MRLLAVLVWALAVGCATQQASVAVPAFPLDALQSAQVERGKLYVAPDGTIFKYTAYVARAGIPDWVHALADEELGAGEEESFEVEQYGNGDQVYEVTRLIDGKKKELSVRTDRTIKYVEQEVALAELPEAIQKAFAGRAGFVANEYAVKEGPGLKEYHAIGQIDGKEYRVVVGVEGQLLRFQRRLPATVELGQAN